LTGTLVALSLQASQYLSWVSGRSRVVQHVCYHVTCSMGGRDACWERQGLPSCMCHKCNPNQMKWAACLS